MQLLALSESMEKNSLLLSKRNALLENLLPPFSLPVPVLPFSFHDQILTKSDLTNYFGGANI